jgi:hypothetical protein
MARYFRERNDEATAALFRPSSMETIRSLGGDALTMVTEMPLFVTPGVGEQIEPSDPIAEGWRERIALWKQHLADPAARDGVRDAIERSGVTAMPIYDQMYLQWTAIRAGIEQLLSTDGAS